MIYVALLRGINVGGNALVSMSTLKTQFESIGLDQVKTYINSGNVIFASPEKDRAALTKQIEAVIRTPEFDIKVLLKTLSDMESLVKEIPGDWGNDQSMKCDVLFLWPEIDRPEIVNELPPTLETEELRYRPGAVVHSVPRSIAAKSRLTRIIGTPLYAQMTLRNINTVRKLVALMQAQNT